MFSASTKPVQSICNYWIYSSRKTKAQVITSTLFVVFSPIINSLHNEDKAIKLADDPDIVKRYFILINFLIYFEITKSPEKYIFAESLYCASS